MTAEQKARHDALRDVQAVAIKWAKGHVDHGKIEAALVLHELIEEINGMAFGPLMPMAGVSNG